MKDIASEHETQASNISGQELSLTDSNPSLHMKSIYSAKAYCFRWTGANLEINQGGYVGPA